MTGVDVPSMINGSTTAIATLMNNTLDNGVRILVSTLRITAIVASVVTCSGTNGITASVRFFISGACIYNNSPVYLILSFCETNGLAEVPLGEE